MKRIILASASPRRKELLDKLGLDFEACPSDYVERITPGLEPHELVRRISMGKAAALAPNYSDALIIAADTLGFIDGDVIGKPETDDDARRILARLSGRWHSVITGFSIIDTDSNRSISSSIETKVRMKNLSRREIDDYIKTGEPVDKAGAYAIQGLGSSLVERIDGDYDNVVGLPLKALAGALEEFGVQTPSDS